MYCAAKDEGEFSGGADLDPAKPPKALLSSPLPSSVPSQRQESWFFGKSPAGSKTASSSGGSSFSV